MLYEQKWCFPTTLFWSVDELYRLKWWRSYMKTKEVFLTYFAQNFCFEPLLLLRDSWCALMIDKQNAVPLVSRCSFLLPDTNLFLKRSEFKQGFFRSFVFVFSATKVTRCCYTQLFFLTLLVFLIDPSKLKTRCSYTFRIPQGPNFLI